MASGVKGLLGRCYDASSAFIGNIFFPYAGTAGQNVVRRSALGLIQKTLSVAWGPPHLGGFLEPATLLAVALLTFLLKRRRPAVYLALATVSLLLVAFPVVFFLVVEPANAEFRRITIGSLPSDWMRWRSQWEYGHAARFVLHFSSFCLLVAALLSHLRGRTVRAARS